MRAVRIRFPDTLTLLVFHQPPASRATRHSSSASSIFCMADRALLDFFALVFLVVFASRVAGGGGSLLVSKLTSLALSRPLSFFPRAERCDAGCDPRPGPPPPPSPVARVPPPLAPRACRTRATRTARSAHYGAFLKGRGAHDGAPLELEVRLPFGRWARARVLVRARDGAWRRTGRPPHPADVVGAHEAAMGVLGLEVRDRANGAIVLAFGRLEFHTDPVAFADLGHAPNVLRSRVDTGQQWPSRVIPSRVISGHHG